ncbi:MAG: hypothetical protein LBR45_03895 [Bacteroidales bacterium]|jgi:hypothetical protein|nr:hypothetical protein [Bacteroidales bacterium]
MEKVKISLIEQLSVVVAQVEKLVTAESFQSGEDFDLTKEETEKLLTVVAEYRQIALSDKNILSGLSALKGSLQQMQQKVAAEPVVSEFIVEPASEPVVEQPSDITEHEHSVVDFTETFASVEEPVLSEAIVTELAATKEVIAEPAVMESAVMEPVAEAQTITSAFQPLDRLRSLSEDKKSESSSTLHAIVSKLRSVPSMPEIQLDQPVDLRTSIGINEKFLFVNDLFKGSIRDCNEAMSLLNELDGFDAAMEKVHEYKEKYAWEEDSLAYLTFVEVLNQRFCQLVLA